MGELSNYLSSSSRRPSVGGQIAGLGLGGIVSMGLSALGDAVTSWREGNIREAIDAKLKLREQGERVRFTATEAAYMAAAAKQAQKAFAEQAKADILAAHYAKTTGQSGKVEQSAYNYYKSTVVEADGTVKYPKSSTEKRQVVVVDDKGNPVPELDEKGQPKQLNGKPVYQTREIVVQNPNILGIEGNTRDANQIIQDNKVAEERENEGVLSKILRNIGDAIGGLLGGGSKRSDKISDAGATLGGSMNLASAKPSGELLALVAGVGNSTVRGGQSVSTAEAVAPASTTVAVSGSLDRNLG